MTSNPDILARAHELRAPVHPMSAALLAQALSVDPARRPNTAAEIAMSLARGQGSGGHQLGTVVMGASPIAAPDAHASAAPNTARVPQTPVPVRPSPGPVPPHTPVPVAPMPPAAVPLPFSSSAGPGRLSSSVPPAPATSLIQQVPLPFSPPSPAASQPPPAGQGGFAPVPASQPRMSPTEPPPVPAQAPRAERHFSTVLADASILAFPDFNPPAGAESPPPAATPLPAMAEPPQAQAAALPAPPPVVRQIGAQEPRPPALVDPGPELGPGTTMGKRREFTATAYAMAARAEWAQGTTYPVGSPIGPDSMNGDLRAVVTQDKQGIKATTIVLLAGGLLLAFVAVLVLLYLLLRMDDSAKFPQPKTSVPTTLPWARARSDR
jgi:hypothetical protein